MIQKLSSYWNNRSLRTKWFSSIAITILIVYAIVCIIIYAALFAWLGETEKNNATRTVDDLQSFFASQRLNITIAELQQQTGLMKTILNQDQTVRLYSIDGTEILRINDYSSEAALKDTTLRTIEQQVVDEIDVYVVQDIITIGPNSFIIQLVHPLTSFQSMMRYVITTMLIMGIGAIILSSVISYFLAGRFIRPLAQLRNSMLAVKQHGVLANNVHRQYAEDELGDLTKIYDEMLAELQQSFTRQQQFVFDASHELRTPIQAIEGNLSLLKRWGKDDKEVLEESLDISLAEIARMKKIMEELLMLARTEKVEAIDAINVVPLLKEVTQSYKQANITLDASEEALYCSISEEALTQIARNFIENSIRYCEKVPEITIAVSYTKETIVFAFTDNGIGIEEEHLPYIFDRFYKADDARIHVEGSTGLGLSIVKMLVDKYNGKLDVESKLGEGSTFFLQFPIKMEQF